MFAHFNPDEPQEPQLTAVFSFLLQDDQSDNLAEVTVTQSESTGAERQEEAAVEGEREETGGEEVVVTQVEEKTTRRSTLMVTLCWFVMKTDFLALRCLLKHDASVRCSRFAAVTHLAKRFSLV